MKEYQSCVSCLLGPPGHEPAVNFLNSSGLSQAVDSVSGSPPLYKHTHACMHMHMHTQTYAYTHPCFSDEIQNIQTLDDLCVCVSV